MTDNWNMGGMSYPPPGHPLYMSPEDREALRQKSIPKEEKPAMASAAALKYQELRAKIAEAKRQMEATAKGLFSEMVADLLVQNPALVSFSWKQYTPYYCDGDPCRFSCHGDYPNVAMLVDGQLWDYNGDSGKLLIGGKPAESSEDLAEKFKSLGVDSFMKNGKTYAYDAGTKTVTVDGKRVPSYGELDKMFKPLEKAVSAFMREFEDEDMQTMFGDHAEVTVARIAQDDPSGSLKITTEEYSDHH